ncbi:MAG: c-type cytochrome biogenesis protein CcmI, partial [Rhizobiaceae bacterium]
MLFWIVAAALTLAAAMAVAQPFLRARDAVGVGAEADMAVYRDQMAEVGRDEDKGLISPAEATEARTEIARRLLKADTGPAPARSFGATGAVIMT